MADRVNQIIRNAAFLALLASGELIVGTLGLYWIGWIR